MQLTVTPEVEAMLERQLQTGHFQDLNELIETAMQTLEQSRPSGVSDWDALIQEGIDSADRGELYTEEEARAYLKEVRAKL